MRRLEQIIILMIIGCSIDLNAQSKLPADIIGGWKPAKVYESGAIIPDRAKQKIETVRKAFLGSKFHFAADHKFSFDISLNELVIKNGHWKIPDGNNEIIIQEWKDKDKANPVVMEITVLSKEGKTIFIIEETFFAFEMVKISKE